MHFYAYRYTASQLTEIAKDVLCVSIIRSSVDTSKLSDDVLTNIVETTYSASSIDNQHKMLAQLTAARDADRQSRYSGGGGTLMPISRVAASKPYRSGLRKPTVSLTRMAVASGSGDESSPPQAGTRYTTYIRSYSATLQINTAAENIVPMESWIYASMYKAFEDRTVDSGIYVASQVNAQSTSNSEIVGHVTVVLSNDLQDAEAAFEQELIKALDGAVSNKCPMPVIRYTVARADEGESGPPHIPDEFNPVGPWPQVSNSAEPVWPEEFFSDIEDVIQGSPVPVPQNYYPDASRTAAQERAKALGLGEFLSFPPSPPTVDPITNKAKCGSEVKVDGTSTFIH
jgi:hypothetical protein